MKRLVAALSLLAAPLAAQVDRTKAPALGAPPALHLPAIRTATLPNGLTLAVVEMHKVPVVEIQALVDAGTARDPADLPGLAGFTANMLTQGAGTRGPLALADEIAYLGAQLNAASDFDVVTVRLHVPKRHLDAALDLLADVLLRPQFADSEVTRQRGLLANTILQQRDQPVAMAGIAFPAIVLGAGHPYGHPAAGNDSTPPKLTRDRVVAFYQAAYRPNTTRILIVGDITLDEAKRLFTARFGAWSRGTVAAFPQAAAPAPAARSFLPGRQAGCRAVGDPHRRAGRRAQHARFRDAASVEHDPRRRFHEPLEPEPARDARLHLRRLERVRGATHARVLRARRRWSRPRPTAR